MRIVITGGVGFIGSHLTRHCVEQGDGVVVFDDLSVGTKKNLHQKASFVHGSILDSAALEKTIEGADCVVHLAALPRVYRSVQNPLLSNSVNITGTLQVILASIKKKIRRFIFASSSSVYGSATRLPHRESEKLFPLSPYAIQKVTGEEYCRYFSGQSNVRFVVLRYFSVFGPLMAFSGSHSTIIGRCIHSKKTGQSVTIYGDGEQTRDFTHVFDVVRATRLALITQIDKQLAVMNICSGVGHSINEIVSITGARTVHAPPRKFEAKYTTGSNAQAKTSLKWAPQEDFYDRVGELLGQYEDNNSL